MLPEIKLFCRCVCLVCINPTLSRALHDPLGCIPLQLGLRGLSVGAGAGAGLEVQLVVPLQTAIDRAQEYASLAGSLDEASDQLLNICKDHLALRKAACANQPSLLEGALRDCYLISHVHQDYHGSQNLVRFYNLVSDL